MITIVSMSRRPEKYRSFVQHTETVLGSLIKQYLVFTNDPQTYPFYKNLELENPKIKVINGPEDFVYRYGHDTVYNYLEQLVETPYILKIFDTDIIEVNLELFKAELLTDPSPDILGMETYMERGDVTETKFQLYRKGILKWYGLVHENQHFEQPSVYSKTTPNLKVYHHNALDPESAVLEKNAEGFILLKKTIEGSDSDLRNLLYETLTWKIVHERGRQDNAGWFHKHYEFNREIVDWYYHRAKKKFKL